MPDISMCSNDLCKFNKQCYRFTATPDEYYQTYGIYRCKDKNSYFVDNKDYKQKRIMKTYCIEVKREIEEQYTFHVELETEPTRNEVLQMVIDEDICYNDNYESFKYYSVN